MYNNVMKILIHLFLSVLAIFVTTYFLPGVHVSGYVTYLILAIILAGINFFIKPILTILTLPLSIITLGLFSIVINAVLIMLADKLVPNFSVDSFLTALLFGVILSIVHFVLKRFD